MTVSVFLHLVVLSAFVYLASFRGGFNEPAGGAVDFGVVVTGVGVALGESTAAGEKQSKEKKSKSHWEPVNSRPEFSSPEPVSKTESAKPELNRRYMDFVSLADTDARSPGDGLATAGTETARRGGENLSKEAGVRSGAGTADSTVGRNRYRRQIIRQINGELVYPVEARRRGLEGNVKVEFYIDTGGRLREKRVVSGRREVLRRAALEALGRAEPFPSPPVRLYSGQGLLKLSHRIKFRLR